MSRYRTTMRARTGGANTSTGFFVPETISRIFPGTSTMSVVVLAKLRAGGATPAVQTDVFESANGPAPAGVNVGGWDFVYARTTTPAVRLRMINAAGATIQGVGRTLVAADEGKVHRFVGVGSVGVGVLVYTNNEAGALTALPTFTPAPFSAGSPDQVGVLGITDQSDSTQDAGMTQFEVMDIAVYDQAFTAAEVAELDRFILSTCCLPRDIQWVEHYEAERVVNHPLVIDVGGLGTGRGWKAAAGVTPILGSQLIKPTDWGGSGT